MRAQSFDFSVNLLRSILWQYESSTKAVKLAKTEQKWFDENYQSFWENWSRDVFNVDTATQFGLSVWSRILDIRLNFDAPKKTSKVFGFGINNKNFGNGNFGRKNDEIIYFDLESARKLIKLRWFQLTMRPTIPNINQALSDVFGVNTSFVQDNLDMTMTYFFTSEPDYKLRQLLENTDILPRPSTVMVNWKVQIKPSFGFGIHHLNFENGNFGV